MNKKTPLVIFTGLAVAAAGTLAAVVTGTYPGALPSDPVVNAAKTDAAPASAPAAQQTAEQPAAPAQNNNQSNNQSNTSTETQVAVAAPEQAEVPVAAKPAEPAPVAAEPKAMPLAPNFDTVRVEPSGEAVIAGHATPGSEVMVKFGGLLVGTATANEEGSFVLIPDKPLPAGSGALTLEAMVDGKLLVAKDQVAIVVAEKKPALVAKVEPEKPTKLVQVPAVSGETPKDVQLSAVDYDEAGNIVFQGRVAPGGTVRFYVDNVAVGDAKADETGNWLFKGTSPIAPGTHTLRADQIDGAGKVLSRAEIPFLREEAAKVVAAAETPQQPAEQQQVAVEQPAQAATATDTAAAPATSTAAGQSATAEEPLQQEAMVAPASDTRPSRIIIQPGNNLWKISRQVYGKGMMFTVIWEANRDLIKNPNRIYPGQILTAPKT